MFITSFFIDKKNLKKDEFEVLTIDNLVMAMLMMLIFLIIYSVYFWVMAPGLNLKNITNLTGCVTIMATLFSVRRYANKYMSALVLNLMGYLFIMTSLMKSGGLYSIDIEWFLLCSVCGFLFVSIRLGITLSIVNSVMIIALFYMNRFNINDFKQDSIRSNGIHELFTFIFLQIIFAVLLYYFVNSLLQTQKEIKRINHLKIEALNELVQEKTRENLNIRDQVVKDFHDVMGNKLASISSMSQMLYMKNAEKYKDLSEELKRINRISKEVYDDTKDFIWTLNLEHNNVFYVYIYIKDFAERLFQNTDIDFISYPIDESYEALMVSQHWSAQLVLLMKEALTNVLVHANANMVKLELTKTPKGISLVLTDNGKGFDKETLQRINGLKNMQERAQRINGCLEINGQINKGTKITFTYTLDMKQPSI